MSHVQVRTARKYAIGTRVDLSGTIAHMRSALVLVYTCGLRTHVYTSMKDPNIFFLCVFRLEKNPVTSRDISKKTEKFLHH